MADVLTFPVDTSPQGSQRFRVRSIRFGDGYQQDVGDGLNNREDEWSVSATGYEVDLQPLMDFLDARAGHIAFLWTPPGRPQALYKCQAYTTTHMHGDQMKLSATFKRTFHP